MLLCLGPTQPTSLTISHVVSSPRPLQGISLRLSVPSSMFAPLPAVGKVGLRATPRPLLRSRFPGQRRLAWKKSHSLQAPLHYRQGGFALFLCFYLSLRCSTFHSAPAVATVGLAVTPKAGTPCAKPRVWQLNVLPLRLSHPLCSLGWVTRSRFTTTTAL